MQALSEYNTDNKNSFLNVYEGNTVYEKQIIQYFKWVLYLNRVYMWIIYLHPLI